jgi:hypothetical protein
MSTSQHRLIAEYCDGGGFAEALRRQEFWPKLRRQKYGRTIQFLNEAAETPSRLRKRIKLIVREKELNGLNEV